MKWVILRSHVNSRRRLQHGLQHGPRSEPHADWAEAQYLISAIHVRLPLANSRRYPPAQIFWIAFDVGGEVEQLFGSIGQQTLSLLARHVSGSLDASLLRATRGNKLFIIQLPVARQRSRRWHFQGKLV